MNRLMWLVLVLSVVACKKEQGYDTVGNYPSDIAKIIVPSCATTGCHDAKSYEAASGLDLSSWEAAFKGTRNGAAIIPYRSDFSTLCYFINTYNALGLQNTPTMPLNGTPLSYNDVKTIRDWIDKGAPSNDGTISDNSADPEVAYVVNQGCDVITVLRKKDGVPIRYISCGTKPTSEVPHQVKVSPDKKYYYVVFINNNILQQFRCSDNALVKNIPLTPAAAGTGTDDALDWNTLVLSDDGKRAYCVSWTQSGHIAAVDVENGKLLHFLGGQHYPHGIALDVSQTKLYITAQTGNFITVLDTGFTSADQVPLSGSTINYASSLDMHEVVPTRDGKQLWVTCQGTNEIKVLDLATRSVVRSIATGTYPQELVYSSTTNCFYTTCLKDKNAQGTGAITRVHATTYAEQTLVVGYQPHGLAVDDGNGWLWVASRNIDASGPLPHHTSACGGRNGFVQFIRLGTFLPDARKFEVSADPYSIFVR